MRPNIVDSSGWIEYFTAGRNGPYFKTIIDDTDQLLVPTIALYEVHKRLWQLVPAEIVATCVEVMRKATVIPLTAERAVAASNIAQQYQLAMADAMMYSIAIEHQATFWTQDADYQGLPSVQFQAKA